MGSLDSRSTARSLDSARDDEHRLIARYAAKLAQEQRSGMVNINHNISKFIFYISHSLFRFFGMFYLHLTFL